MAEPEDDGPTLADIDPSNEDELDGWDRHEEQRAAKRVGEALRDLQAHGIVDAAGNPLRREVHPDMRDDSLTDVA